MNDSPDFLSWFLGPKAENAALLEDALLLVLRDYCHWRRNYFPGDRILINQRLQRELIENQDELQQNLLELLAKLRRNFPFYSPRYVGHMLSETTLPSMLGYIAGMLYNPNNVTPEAAPVTVDMEIDACNVIMSMLGYSPPPDIPTDLTEDSRAAYDRALRGEFGWAHLTQGGTTANLEALWVARSVKYGALALWDVARAENLAIDVKLPSWRPGQSLADIRDLPPRQMLLIKPNEAIYLLSKFVAAYQNKLNCRIVEAGELAAERLRHSEYALAKGVARAYADYPPDIFASGAAHYSVVKAADILGIGRDHVRSVRMDGDYRISTRELQRELDRSLAEGHIPLAVIAVVGTTEEGAVDPVHEITDLRAEYEQRHNTSFWVHVDGAWGGYLRSLFNLTPLDEVIAVQAKISEQVGGARTANISEWCELFYDHMGQQVEARPDGKNVSSATDELGSVDGAPTEGAPKELLSQMADDRTRLGDLLSVGEHEQFLTDLRRCLSRYQAQGLATVDAELTLSDRIQVVNEYVSDQVSLHWGTYHRELAARWGAKDVCSALLAMPKADSITVDPHKMGYVNYPCGMVAFRNDRVRHFILQKAPYITGVKQDVLIHFPPRHLDQDSAERRVVTEAFAQFIVEGSRPGASATSLWLTVKTIPPTMRGSGQIIKASLLGARELYEWLVHWNTMVGANRVDDIIYDFVPLSGGPPDTNIVIFAVKKRTSNSLAKMNALTKAVYEKFTIQTELGDTEYSYSQPFFLSRTGFESPVYPADAVLSHLDRYFEPQYHDRLREEYRESGLVVLRATVMTPYVPVTRHLAGQSIIRDLLEELAAAAQQSADRV